MHSDINKICLLQNKILLIWDPCLFFHVIMQVLTLHNTGITTWQPGKTFQKTFLGERRWSQCKYRQVAHCRLSSLRHNIDADGISRCYPVNTEWTELCSESGTRLVLCLELKFVLPKATEEKGFHCLWVHCTLEYPRSLTRTLPRTVHFCQTDADPKHIVWFD